MRLSKRRAAEVCAIAGGALLGATSIAYPALALVLSCGVLFGIGWTCARSRAA